MKFEEMINKVICGDCLEVMKDIPDKSIDLVLTDPPYNLDKDFKNDNLSEKDFTDFLTPIFNELARVIKDKHSVIIFFDNGQKLPLFWKCLLGSKLKFQKGGTFYKPNDCSMPHNRILRTSEVFYVCSATPELHHEGGKFIHDTIIGNYGKMEGWYHPTAKNIQIIKELVMSHSIEGGVVLDCFLGSGTTAVACKQLKRNFIGIEISEKYCEIAKQRLRQQILL